VIVEIKVLSTGGPVQRAYHAYIENASTSKEVVNEVFKGRQAIGVNTQTLIRCGSDPRFYGVTKKSDIVGWIEKRLKEERK